ncbi:MAG: hypothetical protein ACFFBD_11220 [Candidatus Hodarchaeota archaeon]
MGQKRVKLGKGWHVANCGVLLPVMPGYIVKPGDICERNGEYFRFSKKGLKQINPRKGRALVGMQLDPPRYGVPPQPQRWLGEPFDKRVIRARIRAFQLIKEQCKDLSSLRLRNGKIEAISQGGNVYYVDLRTAEVRDSRGRHVCVVSQKIRDLPTEDIALAKALTIAYGSKLIYTVY